MHNSNDGIDKHNQAGNNTPTVSQKPTILLDGKSLTSTSDTETILETVEKAGLELEFHCREGFCGVCRTKLISGNVQYTLDPLAFIEDDEILICCSKPLGDIALKTLI